MPISKTSPSQYEVTSYDIANKLEDFAVTNFNQCRKYVKKVQDVDDNGDPLFEQGEPVMLDVDTCILLEMEESDADEVKLIAAAAKELAVLALGSEIVKAGLTDKAITALTALSTMEYVGE